MIDNLVNEALVRTQEHLTAASALLKINLYNDSVSRSYYAILDAARSALMIQKIYPKSHSGTIHKFSQEYIKTGLFSAEFGDALSKAEKQRVEADYNYRVRMTEEDAHAVLQVATKFVKAVEAYITK